MAFNPIRFVEEVRREVKRVSWPSWSETRLSTIMVFVMVTLSSVFLFFADQIINAAVKMILGVS